MTAALLKQLRQQNKTSQDEVAKILKVSRPTYLSLETGRGELNISQAQALCAFYGILFADFIDGKITPLAEVMLEPDLSAGEPESLRIAVPQEKVKIFKEVLLYILNKVGGRPNIGQTVIYKLLYFIDFDFYEKFETQLIGAKYMKNHFGPTPIEFAKIVQDMEKRGELTTVASEFFTYPQTKYLPLRKPDLAVFSAVELKHIDEELERLADKTANELTLLSHQDVPWITARPEDVLDYEAVFYRTAETSIRGYDDSAV